MWSALKALWSKQTHRQKIRAILIGIALIAVPFGTPLISEVPSLIWHYLNMLSVIAVFLGFAWIFYDISDEEGCPWWLKVSVAGTAAAAAITFWTQIDGTHAYSVPTEALMNVNLAFSALGYLVWAHPKFSTSKHNSH